MTESIFALLEKVGYTHPLHPPLTHIPMGMTMGCFFFGLLAWKANKAELSRTALHCSVLAIIFIIPTIFAGILDWQNPNRFGGSFTPFIIIKMILAPVLTGLLGYAIWLNRQGASPKKLFIVYTLCLVCAVGLGFCGGELVYGS